MPPSHAGHPTATGGSAGRQLGITESHSHEADTFAAAGGGPRRRRGSSDHQGKLFARKGLKVDVDPAGSRQIATSINLGKYDFAFASSSSAADRIQQQRQISARYAPFSSPMVMATFQPIADLLAKEGVAKHGAVWTFDVSRYLGLVARHVRWDQLKGNTAYPVRKNILVSTTDPRSSNSAAMYLAITSYVANGDTAARADWSAWA